MPVQAGPHALGVAFLKKPSLLLETARQPYQAHFNYYRHPRVQPADLFDFDRRSVWRRRTRRYAQPAPDIRVAVRRVRDEDDRAARQILTALMKRAYRRPVTDADLRGPLALYQKGRADGGFDAGIEMALSAVLVSPHFLFRLEPDPAGHRAEHAVSRQRSRAGVAALLLPLEQHSRR